MPVVSVPEKMLIKTGTLTTCRIPIKSLRLAARTVTPATYDRQFDCPSSQSINLNQFVKNNRPAAANHPGPARGAGRESHRDIDGVDI